MKGTAQADAPEQREGAPRLCDAHVHVMDPGYPFAADRDYTPGPATADMLRRHLQLIGAERAVLVQASPYGTDNRAMLSALERLGPGVARGVAVVDSSVSTAELRALRDAGVMGLRLNIPIERLSGDALRRRFRALVAAAGPHGLSVSLHARPEHLSFLAPDILAAEATVIVEHYALLNPQRRREPGAVDTVMRLLSERHVWLKLCGINKIATAPAWPEARELVQRFARLAPGRLVWGTDWPHTTPGSLRTARSPHDVEPFQDIDDEAALRVTKDALPPALVADVLGHNATRLFGFAD